MLRTLANYAVATGLTIVATNILPIWYLPGPVEHNIETTLWFILAAVIGSLVTFAVEAVFHALNPSNELIDGIDFRLLAVQTLLEAYAKGDAPASETQNRLAQFALVGVGGLRRHLARTSYERLYRTRMSTLVSLTGRSVDFAAALSTSATELPAAMRPRAERLARHIADVRHCMATSGEPCESDFQPEPSPTAPLLFELESMVSLMPTVFSSTSAIDPRLEVLESASSNSRIFAENAFSNPENIRFVLSGTLAAMSCYVLYVSLAWPGLSTSVTTCPAHCVDQCGRIAAEAGVAHRRRHPGRFRIRNGRANLCAAQHRFHHRVHSSVCHSHRHCGVDRHIQLEALVCRRADGACFLSCSPERVQHPNLALGCTRPVDWSASRVHDDVDCF